MIAGIYGMNFKHMPELDWTFGYPMAIGAMVAIDAFSPGRFRKRAGCSDPSRCEGLRRRPPSLPRVPALPGRAPGPAPESAIEARRLGEPDEIGDLCDREVGAAKVLLGERAARLVEQPGEARPRLLEPPAQRARAQVRARAPPRPATACRTGGCRGCECRTCATDVAASSRARYSSARRSVATATSGLAGRQRPREILAPAQQARAGARATRSAHRNHSANGATSAGGLRTSATSSGANASPQISRLSLTAPAASQSWSQSAGRAALRPELRT